MKHYLFVLSLLSGGVMACGEDDSTPQDRLETKDISRIGAIETILTTEHVGDSLDVLVTKHKVWKDNMMVSETTHRDTIPALRATTLKAADSSGEVVNVKGQKDYEFYITVQ